MPFLNVYLNFEGTAEKAFLFYKSIFGGEFSAFSRFGEMPGEAPFPPEFSERILHVSLPVGEHCVLMGSDCPPDFKGIAGNLFNVSISIDDRKEASRLFHALSEGGEIIMPLEDTFWNAYFGMVRDQFGVQWMVNCDAITE